MNTVCTVLHEHMFPRLWDERPGGRLWGERRLRVYFPAAGSRVPGPGATVQAGELQFRPGSRGPGRGAADQSSSTITHHHPPEWKIRVPTSLRRAVSSGSFLVSVDSVSLQF